MFLHIDYHSSQPIYQQAVDQIKLLVVNGSLQPGDKLPSIRELARTLTINPTTAAKIYTELAHEGVLVLRQGQGAFVTLNVVSLSNEEIRRRMGEQAQRLLVEGLRLGLDYDGIQQIIEEEFLRIRKTRDERECD